MARDVSAALTALRADLMAAVSSATGIKALNVARGRLDLFDTIMNLIGDTTLPAPISALPPVPDPARLTTAARRRARALAARGEPSPAWWEAYSARLGIELDSVIAAEAGVSRQRVAQVRARLEIPAPPRFRQERKIQDVQAILARLGTVSDYDLAAEIGRSTQFVAALRRENNIPAFSTRTTPHDRIAEHHALVGKVTDAVVAEQARCYTPQVVQYRKRHNIPAFHAKNRKTGAPDVQPE